MERSGGARGEARRRARRGVVGSGQLRQIIRATLPSACLLLSSLAPSLARLDSLLPPRHDATCHESAERGAPRLAQSRDFINQGRCVAMAWIWSRALPSSTSSRSCCSVRDARERATAWQRGPSAGLFTLARPTTPQKKRKARVKGPALGPRALLLLAAAPWKLLFTATRGQQRRCQHPLALSTAPLRQPTRRQRSRSPSTPRSAWKSSVAMA